MGETEELLSTQNAITPAPGSDSRAKMVMSYSSSMPHLVQRSSNGQYKCDEKCISWISSKICSHSIAVAEVNGDLCSFLQWYNTSGTEPNITALAMSGLPSGRGRKGGVPRRKRTQKKDVPVEHVTLRQATVSSANGSYKSPSPACAATHLQVSTAVSQTSTACSAGHIMLPSLQVRPSLISTSPYASMVLQDSASSFLGRTPPSTTATTLTSSTTPATIQLQVSTAVSQTNTASTAGIVTHPSVQVQPSLISMSPHATVVLQQPTNLRLSSAGQSASVPVHTSPNVNPFYLKFIAGNIRVCQGCKGSLRMKDNSIPLPPFDVVIGRAERRQFRDSKGNLITPRSEQAAHYHLNLQCIKAVEPGFVPQSLTIPPDVLPRLTAVHKEFLRLVFQISGL